MQKLIMIIVSLVGLSACNIFAVPAVSNNSHSVLGVELTEGINFELLSPESFGTTLSLTQSLSIHYESQEFELLTYLEINKQEMTVVAMLPIGTRVFTIVYDGLTIKSEGHDPTLRRIRPEYLLADLQLSLWPMQALRTQLYSFNACFEKNSCSFVETEGSQERQLVEQGRDIINIKNGGRWELGDDIVYSHHLKQYQINVQTLEAIINNE